ncbi:hypothetical protein ABIA39_008613 [Nocardia sp. GAS34]|uniref:hypothetical protein n=1 Tax=unclassified Nocardia TaxID=2637762 RepID=UPI003D21C87F
MHAKPFDGAGLGGDIGGRPHCITRSGRDIENATGIQHIEITDSPAILFTTDQWNLWQHEVATDRFTNANGCVKVSTDNQLWHVIALEGTEFIFDQEEWNAFRSAVIARESHPATVFQ